MACSSTDNADCGFATPAAMMVSLVIAIGAAALIEAGWADLKLARADLARTQIEAALEGAEESAAVSLLSGGALDGSYPIGGRNIQILLEPEAQKTSVAAVISMDDRLLVPLGVTVPLLKARLKGLTIAQAIGPEFEEADASAQWRACARSLISPFGLSETLRPVYRNEAVSGAASSRGGEIWRIRAMDPSGWVDERVVRLTGDNIHPAATLGRRFWKRDRESARCNIVFNTAG